MYIPREAPREEDCVEVVEPRVNRSSPVITRDWLRRVLNKQGEARRVEGVVLRSLAVPPDWETGSPAPI
eukprot:2863056-Alexandrium_andersonii.AAC.1